MAPNEGARLRWQGLLSVLFFLTTITSNHRASSYSNHINIDDIDDEDVASTTVPSSFFQQSITLTSFSPSREIIPSFEKSSSPPTTDFPFSSIPYEHQHNGANDANEAPYHFNFSHPIYNVTIPENSVQKTFAIQPYTDLARMGIQLHSDGLHHIDVKYQIVSGDKNKVFKAEERVVGDFAFLTIRTRTNNIVLNREKGDSYRLKVRATVSRSRIGTKKRIVDEAETIVDVKVLDKNDLSPLFYPTKYSITITDDTPLHQSIVRVTAEDADVGINGEIYYSLLNETEQFAVHPSSGVLTLTRSLESSGNTYFQLTVLATDRASLLLNSVNSQSNFKNNQHAASKASVEIFVQQTNLHSPEIHLQALNEIVENSNANIYGIVRVTDGDHGIHGEIKSLEIVDGDPDGHFRVKPSPSRPGEFVIEVHKLLDREATPNGYNITLRAVDKGVPPRDSYKKIPVRLIDFNDNKPVFNREIYEISVPEIAPINTPVIRLKVSDRDDGKNAQVYLQIVGGNENGEFRINPETGMLYTNALLDAETKHFYTLTVSAIDQGNTGTRKQSSAKVKINIEDRNDENPVFEKANITIWVDENEPAGSIVTKVKATDADSSENAYVSYSIANLNEVPFDIDHFSGSVRTSKLLDYETMRREYVLHIRASDWGQPYRRQTEMKLFIKLRNVNDHRPQFERIDCVGQIPRHLPIGSELITLSAVDFDGGDVISYRIVSGNEDGCFNLDSATGLISLGCDLQDLGVDRREVNVTATDGTHFADNTRIQINLISSSRRTDNHGNFECRTTDVSRKWAETQAQAERNNAPGRDLSNNEDFALMPSRYGENIHAPEFVNFPLEIKVNETVPLGTTIGWIKARDRDLGYNGKLVYGISDGDNDSLFRLDLETGELKVIGFLDREKEDEYLLNVTVYDLGFPSQKSISRLLPISVQDENDCYPTFEKSIASLHVSESARNNTIIFRFNATDRDKGVNGKVTYSLVTDTKDFSIDRETGILTISAPLDREKQDLYELRVKAMDGGERALTDSEFHSLSSEALLQIKIDDFNDNAPQFHLTDYSVRVREDIPVGSVVVTVTANDLDIGNNAEILYTFAETAGSDGEGYFKIDKQTGTIRTAKQLDFEERQIHSLIINAIDKGIPTQSSSAMLIVEVIDVNENRFAPQFEDFVMEGRVKENQNPGTHVMKVEAKDFDDTGPDSRISYTTNGGDGLGLFAIDNEGNIRTMMKFDAETKSHYWLTVCAQDHGIVPLHSCIEVYIQIENENDNVPLTEQPVYYPSVPENSPAGTKIIQLNATDDDNSLDQKVSFRLISGNPEGFFSINATTGLITTTSRRLDRENQPEHILEVMIMDEGEPTQLSSTTRVVISVSDVNDNAPEFDQKSYNVEVPSNAKIDQKLFQDEIGNNFDQFGSTKQNSDFHLDTPAWEFPNVRDLSHGLFRVLAFDKDEGDNGRVRYSIKSGKGKAKFRIHPDNGIVYAAKTLDQDSYDLTIKCEDNGNPKKAKTTSVRIEVVQVTEDSPNPPRILQQTDQAVDVTENDQPGYLITDFQAEDEDGDRLWFEITEGDDNNDFYISPTGNVLLAKKLDCEVKKEYNLTIAVTDGTHVVKSHLYVSVINSNDHRPEFTEQEYHVEISENTEQDSEILQLHATDADDDKKLFYSLHTAKNPASLNLFRVDSVSGVISLMQKLDRELIAEHLLVVSVKDQGTPAKRNFAKVIIKVHDFNNHIPEFTSKLIQGKVYETASVGTRVVQVYAIDRDAGDNAKITYSIVSGNIGNAFEIDENLGIISLVKELDIQALPEYMLQVKASDNGRPSLSSQIPVHIMVQMADNAPPRFTTEKKDRAAEIFENLPIGSFVKHLEVRSTSSVLFEIISGNENDIFFINPSQGLITTKDEVDYEQNNFFNLTIRATNMAAKETTCNLIIQVLDRNDNNPFFEQAIYRGEISESAPIGSLVTLSENGTVLNETIPLVIKARDNDSGQNALLHFDIIEYLPRKYFHIDSSSGAIKNIFILDYEKIPFYSFNVKVSDLGKPRLTSLTTARVEIKIINVNDCAPTFKQKDYNVTLLLPTYENVAVVQVNATDKDSLDDSFLRYDIIDGNSDKVFSINPNDGTIVTTRHVEKIKSFYKLHVRVSDGKYSTISYVYVKVENSENSGLVFQKPVYENSVAENSTRVQTVCIVNVLGTALNEHVEFRILNPTDMFRIGLTSGAIETTGKRFDREEKDNYELIVEAKSQMGENQTPRIAHVVVKVSISDENDNCPIFVNLPYYAVVSVDDPKGSVIIKVQAIDLDAHENGEVRYEMKKGHGELFKVDRKTGEVILKQTLEGHNKEYQLLISAFDGGIIPCSTDVIVNVKTQDKNMPTFSNMGKNWYSDSVPENIELHSPLSVQIQATSPMSRKLIYSIVKGNELEEFAVDFNTALHTNSQCAIYVVDELDFETKQSYDLIIRATDSVSGVYAEVPLSIAVSDVNDCPPTLPQDNYDITVSESAPFGSVILKVAAQDNDGPGLNSEISYSIQTDNKNSSEFFHIDENEGTVFLKKSLDHETLQHHHFTIRVSDKGSPALSSTAHVSVHVSDSSDNPPFFEQLSYECVLSQEATRGQFVTVLSADDPDYIDSNKLIYTIVEGNEQQTYHLDPYSGIITLMNMQNFGDTQIAVLNVSVTDGVYTSYTRVKITILPANLHNPQFEQLVYEAKVNENQLAGRLVSSVKAKDDDFGKYGKLTYAIVSDEMKEAFDIDADTGDIITKIKLDRETKKNYDMLVIATDEGGRSGFTTVRVSVVDENEFPPQFVNTEYKAVIPANISRNIVFLWIKAVDLDENQNAAVKYAIYDSENKGIKDVFGINEQNGGVYLKFDAVKFENQMFQFFVRAHDTGIPSLHSDVPVSVYVMASSEIPPAFEKKEKNLFLSENSEPGTLISRITLTGNVTAKLRLISVDDPDDPQFTINSEGELKLGKTLDREAKDLYYINILAETDSSPPLTAISEIELRILDVNDVIPAFESNLYSLAVAENIEKGSSILKVHAHDGDSGSNGNLRYSLDKNAGDVLNIFDIDSYTGWLTTLVALDRETQSEYKFSVIATDNGPDIKHSTKTSVVIKVLGYNDNSMTFKKRNYEASVNENALPGTVLLQLKTTDKDEDAEAAVDFYITSGDLFSQFQIRQSGELYVAKPLDRESIDSYLLTILVTDGKFIDITNVTITVQDSNDNPQICLKYRYQETLSESVATNQQVLTILYSDADEAANTRLRFYLTGSGAEDFHLDEHTGVLRTARQLDRESQSKYKLIAFVQDRDHFGWECSSIIEISLTDVNDERPIFTMDSYNVFIPEDADVGSLVTKVLATDNDRGINRKIRYSFVDSHKDHFKIEPESGIVTLMKPLDREQKALYNLTLRATDQGEPSLSTTTSLVVNVQDINDSPPVFTSNHYAAKISESESIGTSIIKLLATSNDIGINAEISYAIIGGNDHKKFTIDKESGVVSLADSVDFERSKDYFLTVQATDGGTPPLSSLSTLNISISDFNDNPPAFSQSSYQARIREDAEIGDKILQVRANDLDSDENGKVRYSIEKGDRMNQFNIEEDTGYISVANELDREGISSYVLEVVARDGGFPELSTYVLVNLEISDANDNYPTFSERNYTAVVQENKPIGFHLIKFEVIDNDASPNAEPFTFEFISGNENGAFRIDEQDGILKTATKFNHKIKDRYQLKIRVFDNGSPVLYSDAEVTVKIIEESQYPPYVTPLEIYINSFDDEYPGGRIGKVFASDQDSYDTLTFDLVAMNGASYKPTALFNISKEDGSLYAYPRLDSGEYRLNVTVSDNKFVSSTIIKVSVEIVSEEMLQNAISIRAKNISPEEFILSKRKTFIRALKEIIHCRLKDVILISVQKSSEMNENHKSKRQTSERNLDILFAVRKSSMNHGTSSNNFYSPSDVRRIIEENVEEIEDIAHLKISEVIKAKCLQHYCIHGDCEDRVIVDSKFSYPISTDMFSFASAHHEHKAECNCKTGFGGDYCQFVVNECAKDPCKLPKKCVPDKTERGYHCACDDGFFGTNCDKETSKCNEENCYNPRNPVTFSGKSYAHYKIDKDLSMKTLEEQIQLQLRVRTVQLTGNLMYAAGKVDYMILELQNGVVQFRFDLGSGEGLVSVSSIHVSDGLWHEIRLEREGNSARLIIDGKHTRTGVSPGVNGILNVQSHDLYFGAEVRPHPTVIGIEDIQRGFIGCLDDLKLSRATLPLQMNAAASSSVAVLKRFANVDFNCEASSALIPLGKCKSQNLCFNGGTCKEINNNNNNEYECQCHERFAGKHCEEDRDPCSSSPCLFGGKCRDEGFGNYTCECPARMSGRRCDFGRFCLPNPCRHSGVCEEGDDGPICMCRGFTGKTCEIDVDECANNPCLNGATCVNEAGSFRCICPPDLKSCGDPLYSNSIISNLINNTSLEQKIIIIGAIVGLVLLLICLCFCCCCNSRRKAREERSVKNNVASPINSDYKRVSKMSNLEVVQQQQQNQRPASYAATSDHHHNVPYNPIMQYNNLDTLRNYGSAGDELENLPPEYRKLNRNPMSQQMVNINNTTGNSSDTDTSSHKQNKWDQIHLQTFSDKTKINNDKRLSPHHHATNHFKQGVLQGRLLPSPAATYAGTTESGAYDWDVSDWKPRSLNVLSNITEVPGSEVIDSSSFHSNESNESNSNKHHQPNVMMESIGTIMDPSRDIETLNENIELDFPDDSEGDRSEQPLSINFDQSLPYLNPLDSGSDVDYRFNTAETYVRHPNSYLPKYNIQSETDGESIPLTHSNDVIPNKRIFKNGVDIGPHQILQSDEDEDDVPAYGFPSHKRRNRVQQSDLELELSKGGEGSSLLGHTNLLHMHGDQSQSDLSVKLCEIEDSETDELNTSNNYLKSLNTNKTNWTKSTDV